MQLDRDGLQVYLITISRFSTEVENSKLKERYILEEWIIVLKRGIKNHLGQVFQFMLPRNFVCKVILVCHGDNGHLGMERTLGLLQERFFWPKMAEGVHTHIYIHVIDV